MKAILFFILLFSLIFIKSFAEDLYNTSSNSFPILAQNQKTQTSKTKKATTKQSGTKSSSKKTEQKSIKDSDSIPNSEPKIEAPKQTGAKITINAKEDNLHYNKGIIAAEKNDFETALNELDTALSINPKNQFALYARATVHFQLGNYELALNDLDKLLAIEKRDEKALYLRSVTLQQTEQYHKAIPDLTILLKIDPKNTIYHLNLAYCHQMLGNLNEAIQNYLNAEKYGAKEEDIVQNLALLYYQKEQNDKSLEYINRALKKKLGNREIYSLHIYNLLVLKKCGEAESALNSYGNQIDELPRALMNLGICFLNNNEGEKAVSYFEKSYEQDNSSIINLFNIAVGLFRIKKDPESLTKFQEFMVASEGKPEYEKQREEAQKQIDFLKEDLKKRKVKFD